MTVREAGTPRPLVSDPRSREGCDQPNNVAYPDLTRQQPLKSVQIDVLGPDGFSRDRETPEPQPGETPYPEDSVAFQVSPGFRPRPGGRFHAGNPPRTRRQRGVLLPGSRAYNSTCAASQSAGRLTASRLFVNEIPRRTGVNPPRTASRRNPFVGLHEPLTGPGSQTFDRRVCVTSTAAPVSANVDVKPPCSLLGR